MIGRRIIELLGVDFQCHKRFEELTIICGHVVDVLVAACGHNKEFQVPVAWHVGHMLLRRETAFWDASSAVEKSTR